MDGAKRQRLRRAFEEAPELYDRARPGYPVELFGDLLALTGLRRGQRVLEIGCGTGLATVPLAQRGLDVVCVELGEELAAVARRKLTSFPRAEVINADFEAWESAVAFDGVVAFTAIHWVDPAVRYKKAARLLRERGALAVVDTRHVLPLGGDDFFVEVQADYEAIVPDDEKTRAGPPRPPEEAGELGGEIEASGCFRNVAVRRYLWDVEYSADEYLAVLGTYAGHRALDEGTRSRLYARIRRRIESRPEQRVRKTYLATLNVAERLMQPT